MLDELYLPDYGTDYEKIDQLQDKVNELIKVVNVLLKNRGSDA